MKMKLLIALNGILILISLVSALSSTYENRGLRQKRFLSIFGFGKNKSTTTTTATTTHGPALLLLNTTTKFVYDANDTENVVRFHVYTYKNGRQSFQLHKDKVYLLESPTSSKTLDNTGPRPFTLASMCDVKTSKFKLLVHGFAETWNMTYRWNWVSDLKNEMLKTSEAASLCVIAVDWKELARGGLIANYFKAIKNMQIAADIMSSYLREMRVNEKNVHCVGFSLGAHMCAILGKTYFSKYGVKLERATGLDPAGPFFHSMATNEKLHFTDANFVDILHTSDAFGLSEKHGHMDFFPDNGPGGINACDKFVDRYENDENIIIYQDDDGDTQKSNKQFVDVFLTDKELSSLDNSLQNSTLSKFTEKFKSALKYLKGFLSSKPKRIFLKFHQFFGCSHLMSVRYFLYSMNSCQYRAVQCDTKEHFRSHKCKANASDPAPPLMGFYADKADEKYKKSFGNFFITTTVKAPYCSNGTTTEETAIMQLVPKDMKIKTKHRHHHHYYY